MFFKPVVKDSATVKLSDPKMSKLTIALKTKEYSENDVELCRYLVELENFPLKDDILVL